MGVQVEWEKASNQERLLVVGFCSKCIALYSCKGSKRCSEELEARHEICELGSGNGKAVIAVITVSATSRRFGTYCVGDLCINCWL